MSRKHFEAIARTIRYELDAAEGNFEPIGRAAMVELTKQLASTFAGFNPAFDRERFLTACGI